MGHSNGQQFSSSVDNLAAKREINNILDQNAKYINDLIRWDLNKDRVRALRADLELKRKQEAIEKAKNDIWERAEKSSQILSDEKYLKRSTKDDRRRMRKKKKERKSDKVMRKKRKSKKQTLKK